jgi:hypothetical protein
MAIWNILWTYGTFYGFGIKRQEKSGNPAESVDLHNE